MGHCRLKPSLLCAKFESKFWTNTTLRSEGTCIHIYNALSKDNVSQNEDEE